MHAFAIASLVVAAAWVIAGAVSAMRLPGQRLAVAGPCFGIAAGQVVAAAWAPLIAVAGLAWAGYLITLVAVSTG